MSLKMATFNRNKKLSRKNVNMLREKRMQNAVKTELFEKLKILEEVDSIEIEVAERVAPMFSDIVMNDVGQLYEYQQIDNTHYIFMNKEVEL